MPATPADIAAGSREASISIWTNPGVQGRYPSARDGSASPATGYFDTLADATAVITARGGLIGVERRRFTAVAHDVLWPDVSTGLPCVHLTDPEQSVDATCLPARIELDLEAETTTYELFG